MKTISKLFLTLSIATVSITSCAAQIKNSKTEVVKIYGNCGMCEKNIETAAFVKKEAVADWDVDSKMATITYDSTKTTLDDILKRIAYAGYDSDKFLAPDEVYNNLHGCCQYERPKKTTTQTVEMEHEALMPVDSVYDEKPVIVVEEIVDANVMADVYANYFALKTALTKDDAKTANSKAKLLVQSILNVSTDKMNSEQKALWIEVSIGLKTFATKISETTDLKTQRNNFASLSEKMYTLTKEFKADGTIYYQHCPMFNDGKGADWLSQESSIKNPYYGTSMLTCGSLEETIK